MSSLDPFASACPGRAVIAQKNKPAKTLALKFEC